jgi:hypothetical protein
MVRQEVTVMALLRAHKQKGEIVLKFAVLVLSKHVLCILYSLPAILFIYCKENIFFKSKSIGDVTLHEIRVYTFACIAFNNSERLEEMFQIRAR